MTNSIPIYIINLKRNPERRLHIKRQLDVFGLKYQFIDVDDIDKYELESKSHRTRVAQSMDIDISVLEKKYHAILDYLKTHYRDKSYERHKNQHLGALATTLSHIRIYDLMIKNDIAAACILEDDATLLPTFPKILNAAPKLEWDILLLASYPSTPLTHWMRNKSTMRIRVFNKDILFTRKQIKNHNHSKKQKHRIKCILEKYGFTDLLYPKQSQVIAKAIQEHDARYAEITKSVTSARRLSLVKHEQYLVYKELRRCIKDYAFFELGALPEKLSLNPIFGYHFIAKLKESSTSVAAYLVKKEAAIKWKQYTLDKNPLAIDRFYWQLYKNEKLKVRLVTPPCATVACHYLIYSARCR